MKSCKASILALIFLLICVGAVSAGTLSRIYISPGGAAINKGARQQFKVYGLDADGNDVPVSGPVTWSVDPRAGSITQDGILTANTTVGSYPEAVKATVSGCLSLSAMAAVDIVQPIVSGDFFFERSWSDNAPGENTGRKAAVDSQGNIYVADRDNNRIQKFDSQGNYLMQWGSWGSGDGQFWTPSSIAIDLQDKVYVADGVNSRIQVFSADGTFIRQWEVADADYNWIGDIAIDSSGNIYATIGNYTIEKFNSSGTLLTKWGTEGTGDGQFTSLESIAIDKNDTVYTLEIDKVQMFDASGKFISKWNSGYNFFPLYDIATDTDGTVYVAGLSSILKYDSSGNATGYVTCPNISSITIARDGKIIAYSNSKQNICIFDARGLFLSEIGYRGLGRIEWPECVAVDSNRNTYLTVPGASYILKFSPDGSSAKKLSTKGPGENTSGIVTGLHIDANDIIYVVDTFYDCIKKFDCEGNFIAKFPLQIPGMHSNECHMAIGLDGSFYLSGLESYFVSKYDSAGRFVTKWGGNGTGNGQFDYNTPFITVDKQGYVYVSDPMTCVIQKFDSSGNFIRKWDNTSGGDTYRWCPNGILTDSKGDIYVADLGYTRILKLESNGQFISKWQQEYGGLPGQFAGFYDIAMDKAGRIYAGTSYKVEILGTFTPSVGAAKTQADGEIVSLTNQITTAGTTNFGDCFYIESMDRTSGIKVTGVTAYGARKASVVGVLATVNGEREIQAFSCTATTSGNVKPLAMNNKAVGGGKTGYQDGVWRHQTVLGEDGKPKVEWAKVKGLNNIGLFIRTFGKVISTDPTAHTFIVSDGSSQDGIKCWAPTNVTLPAVGNIIAVNGVSTCERNERGELTSLLRLRGAVDITTIKKVTL